MLNPFKANLNLSKHSINSYSTKTLIFGCAEDLMAKRVKYYLNIRPRADELTRHIITIILYSSKTRPYIQLQNCFNEAQLTKLKCRTISKELHL